MTQTFTQRGLSELEEAARVWEEKKVWRPFDVAASHLRTRWALGADRQGHAGGVLPGMVFNSKAQLALFGVHGCPDDMFWTRKGKLVSIMFETDSAHVFGDIAPPPPSKSGNKSKTPPPPFTGAHVEERGQFWSVKRRKGNETIKVLGKLGEVETLTNTKFRCKGDSGHLDRAMKEKAPIRLVVEVAMPWPKDCKEPEAEDLPSQPWHIYLGLFYVVRNLEIVIKPDDEGNDTHYMPYELQGVPQEHITWEQMKEVAGRMMHTTPIAEIDKAVWKPTTSLHEQMLRPRAWPALPSEMEAEDDREGSEQAVGSAERERGSKRAKSRPPTEEPQQQEEEEAEGEAETPSKRQRPEEPQVPVLSPEEEEETVTAWREGLSERPGLVELDLSKDCPAKQPLPVFVGEDVTQQAKDALLPQLKFRFLSDYQWTPKCLVKVARTLQCMDAMTRRVARQPGAEFSRSGAMSEAEAQQWWEDGYSRPFCASQFASQTLNERHYCEGHRLTEEELDRELPAVCPFDDETVMKPDYNHPHVVHQCNHGCQKYSVLCDWNTQIPQYVTLPLELYVNPQTQQWAVRCAIPIAHGRFICCVLGELTTAEELGLSSSRAAQHPSGLLVPLRHLPGAAPLPAGVGPAPDLVVDMRAAGNTARFIRHSSTPNLRLQVVYARSCRSHALYYMALVADRDIPADEELTFDHHASPWTGL